MEIVIAAGDLASATKTGGVLLSETFNIPHIINTYILSKIERVIIPYLRS